MTRIFRNVVLLDVVAVIITLVPVPENAHAEFFDNPISLFGVEKVLTAWNGLFGSAPASTQLGQIAASVDATYGEYGDRKKNIDFVYPSTTLLSNGGRLLDVTKAPFNAKGDGKADDTQAILRAVNYVADRLRTVSKKNTAEATFIIYFRSGTYLVSDSLVYSGTMDEAEQLQNIRYIGQNRANTTIKLRDNSPGFGSGAKKPVLASAKGDFNNLETRNTVRGLTIDTGWGNPGVIGIRFDGANANHMSDIVVRSGDGRGYAGIYMIGGSQFYMHDITVDGFDAGIRADHEHVTSLSLEYISLNNQRTAGIFLTHSSIQGRRLFSNNSVPALRIDGTDGMGVLVDSKLHSGSGTMPAIDLRDGALFIRDIDTQGYANVVKKGINRDPSTPAVVRGPYVKEYISHAPLRLYCSSTSFALPVEDVPYLPRPNAGEWAIPANASQAAVQAAFNSGKPGVLFKNASYNIGTISVMNHVEYVNFMYAQVSGTFNVAEASTVPVFFEDATIGANMTVRTSKNRPVVMQHMTGRYISDSPDQNDKLFMNAIAGIGANWVFENGKLWARMINNEPKSSPAFTWDNATTWILGYKTETSRSAHVIKGGRFEVLGGFANQTSFRAEPLTGSSILEVTNADVSYSGYTTGFNLDNVGYDFGVVNTRNGTTNKIAFTQLPVRPKREHQAFMPLYVDCVQE